MCKMQGPFVSVSAFQVYRWNHVVDATMPCNHILAWSSCESIPMAGALQGGLPSQTASLKKKVVSHGKS